jgi:hypothetical protein
MNSNEPEQSAAEMRSLLRLAQGLGLDEATVREIYETVGREAMAAGITGAAKCRRSKERPSRRDAHPRRSPAP